MTLIYFILIRVKFGKKYFDYLNVILFVFYLLTTFASLFTIFQSFGFSSILSLSFNVILTLYFGYSFFSDTAIGKDLKLADSPLAEIKNLQYFYLLICIIAIELVVSLISVGNFEEVVVYLLEAIYEFLLVRYIYLYKEYIDNKNAKKVEKTVEKVVEDNKVDVKEDSDTKKKKSTSRKTKATKKKGEDDK